MIRKIIFSLLSLAMVCVPARSEAPEGYYKSLTGKSTSALKTALYEIINPHTQVSSYNALPSYFRKTDVRPGTSFWWDMYSDMDVDFNIQFGTYMNREHSLPKSWWGGSTAIPAYVDLYHLYPGEAKANQAKSNYPLGEIAAGVTPSFNNGISKVGTGVNSGGAKYVFEPANEYKGDFARTYFYMVTCYQNLAWTTTWQVANGTYPTLQQWAIDLLLKWHRADPVSEKETARNEEVYKIQNNRNPFIDHPELAEYIWGNKKGEAYQPSSGGSTTTDATLFTPVQGMYLDFGEVALGHSIEATLFFRGENITGNFDLRIIGVNKSLFAFPAATGTSPQATTLAGSAANTTAGTSVVVRYTPNAIGSHEGKISVNNTSVLPNGLTVFLKAQCLAEPTLSRLTATEATSVTEDSYVARWDSQPSDEVVDYYMVTVKRYMKDGTVTTTEYPAEVDSLQIDGLSEGEYDTYAVQSVRLEVRSPMSNYVTVRAKAGIDDILVDEPYVVEGFDGFVRFRCSSSHTNARIYDLAGRTVAIIPVVEDLQEFALPHGIYFITTDQSRRPAKVVVR